MIPGSDTSWDPQATRKDIYAYDSNSNKILSESYDWRAGEWVGRGTKYVYEYDANSNETSAEQHTWDDGEKVQLK